METKITSKSDNCPVESPPPAPTKSDSKIGRLKVRTPAEINKEFEGTSNSEEMEGTSNSADSSDQLRAFSFADFLRPPDPSPSLPTVSQLKEPSSVPVVLTVSSAQVVKTKRKSKYPGFGQTILFEKIKNSTKSSSSRAIQEKVGINCNSSSQFKVNLAQYQVTPRCPRPGFNPQGIIPTAAVTKSFLTPASVTGSNATPPLTRSNPNGSSITSFPMPTSITGSYPMPALTKSNPNGSSVTSFPMPISSAGSYPTPKTILSYSIPASGSTSFHSPSSVLTLVSTPASDTSSRPAMAVPNEAGSGTRRYDAGFGETAISSPSQRNQLKRHSVSDTDARDISASWRKIKPTEVLTSASTSKFSADGSSSSQIVEDHVGEGFSSGFKAILPKSQDSPKLPESYNSPKQLNPGVEKEKPYNISKVNTPSTFSFPANSTGSQVNEKTKNKFFPNRLSSVPTELNFYRENSESTSGSASHCKSKPGVQGSNMRKKYREKSSIYFSKYCDWDSSLKEWIPRDISASWRKLKPIEVLASASTSKSSADGSSSSQSSFSFPANWTGSQVNEKTKYKGLPSRLSPVPTELSFYRESSESTSGSSSHCKSKPNKPGVQGSKMRKKYRGFGESTSSEDLQVIEKTRNKSNQSSDKTAKKQQKSSIYELDEISKYCEEDWDSSLRQWIPSEPYDHIQKRKVQKTIRGLGEATQLVTSQTKKDKSNSGVRSHFEKTNLQQAKIQKSRARKGINQSGENTAGSSTDSTPEDFSSERIEKLDENENNNAQRNFEVENGNFNYDDMITDTDTEDDGREKLLDGVVMTISGYEDPLRGRIVRKAVAMGASYRPGWTNDCSHLVCGFIGTFKYLQAKGRGKIVLGTWIEDCYKSRKKVNWMEYILSEETDDSEPVDETSSSGDGLKFLAGMEVRVKENYMIKRLAGKTGVVSGMHSVTVPGLAGKSGLVSGMNSDTVQVMIQGCEQLWFFPQELEHLLPEKGSKAMYVLKGEDENIMEVISVDEGKDIAVVRFDGHKGAVVKLSHLCRMSEDTIASEI